MNKTHNRIAYVDIAKIIGMFFIVYGHILRNGMITTWIYTFHVPLFFFLSGITFHGESLSFENFLKKKMISLLLPFFSWAMISMGIYIALSHLIPEQMMLQSNVGHLIVQILMGYCEVNSPLWFLPCLFIVEVLMWIIEKLTLKLGKGIYLLVLIMSVVVCIAWPVFNEKEIFWNIHNAFILLPFTMIGYVSGEFIKKTRLTLSNLGFSTILLVGGGTVGTVLNHQISYLGCYYGNIVLFYLSAMTSIFGICYLCKYLSLGKYAMYYGSNTLSVLVMHKFIVTFFLICPIIKKYIIYTHPLICAGISIMIMCMCFRLGRILSYNKLGTRILLGR